MENKVHCTKTKQNQVQISHCHIMICIAKQGRQIKKGQTRREGGKNRKGGQGEREGDRKMRKTKRKAGRENYVERENQRGKVQDRQMDKGKTDRWRQVE